MVNKLKTVDTTLDSCILGGIMKANTTKPKAVLHGECIIFQSKIPASAKEEVHKDDETFVIVAESEVTGNHHVIDRPLGVKFYRDGEKRYMQNDVPTQVRCVIESRHSNITLSPGQWEFGVQKEFDYHAMAKKNVAD
jgi:hypothetical protein